MNRFIPGRRLMAVAALALLSACAIGPKYQTPSAPVPTHYKEADGWKIAQPQEIPRDSWWSVYDDPVLSDIEAQAEISNQNIKEEAAAYQEALAVVKQAQAGLFPTLTANASVDRSGGGSGSGKGGSSSSGATASSGGGGRDTTQYGLSAAGSWEPDLWGRVRSTVSSDQALAQSTQDDLAGARLSAQTTIATDYFQLRAADQLKTLLDEVIADYRQSLKITQNQYDAGTVAQTDVITAQTQLEGAESQEVATGVQRAQLEHAIAVLIGKAPADFSIDPEPLRTDVPTIPPGMPSTLLERRPDIASAERQMASANAQVGVAQTAFFPDLTLSATFGFASTTPGSLLSAPNSLWSIGSALAETLFDGGARSAQVDQAKAVYDEDVAKYRQTVLGGFQQVEDALASLRILEQQAAIQDRAVASAREAVRLTLNQYQAGTIAYTAVVSAQATLLSDRQTALSLLENRLAASVALIDAVGGGWDSSQPPTSP